MSAWEKRPAYTGTVYQGCLCCPPVERAASMKMLIAVGFGAAIVSKDGTEIFDGERADEFHYLQEFEDMAKADPDHDWRVLLDAPLRSREYQRHGEGIWTLIDSGPGFA